MEDPLDFCFAVYIASPEAGEDKFVPGLTCRSLIDGFRSVGAGGSARTAEINIRKHLKDFPDLPPVRISMEKILAGVDAGAHQAVSAWLQSKARRFEPQYSSVMEVIRKQHDTQLVRARSLPQSFALPYRSACEAILAAKNLIFNHVMTSAYRIVISSHIRTKCGRAMAITARDSRRDADGFCRTVLCWPKGDTWLFWTDDDSAPSSSFVSFWACHDSLLAKAAHLSQAIVHCHAREALDFYGQLRSEDREEQLLSEGIGLIEGPARSVEFGRRLAQGLASGLDMLLLPQEGTYVAGASVTEAAHRTVRVAARLRQASPASSTG